MQKVQMMIQGKAALVDADQVKKLITKQQLVDRALKIQGMTRTETDPTAKRLLEDECREVASKIIRLNRTIRKNVQFI